MPEARCYVCAFILEYYKTPAERTVYCKVLLLTRKDLAKSVQIEEFKKEKSVCTYYDAWQFLWLRENSDKHLNPLTQHQNCCLALTQVIWTKAATQSHSFEKSAHPCTDVLCNTPQTGNTKSMTLRKRMKTITSRQVIASFLTLGRHPHYLQETPHCTSSNLEGPYQTRQIGDESRCKIMQKPGIM